MSEEFVIKTLEHVAVWKKDDGSQVEYVTKDWHEQKLAEERQQFQDLQYWVQMVILGLRANPNYSDLGGELQQQYDKFVENGFRPT